MKVLITGAFGMIGRVLIQELEQAGHELRLMDVNDPAKATVFVPGRPERQLSPIQTRWPVVKGSILDIAAVAEAVAGMDAVINLAAAVTGLPEHGPDTMHTNCCGTYIVLDEARKAGVRRVLVASSINAYGCFYWRLSGKPPVYKKMPIDESYRVCFEDSYSLSKYVNELTCATFTRAFGITTAAFRFAGVRDHAQYLEMRANRRPTAAWSDDLYQWVHVADVAHGLRQALERPRLRKTGVYTLGAADTRCPEPTMDILRKFRPDLARTVKDPSPGRWPLLSIKTAAKAFGYASAANLLSS